MSELGHPQLPAELGLDEKRIARARSASWQRHGKRISFYLPGMYVQDGVHGRYPALSITGSECSQHCAHCAGKLLVNMPDVHTPERLLAKCRALSADGVEGVLLSGGCDGRGQIPWPGFIDAIRTVKEETGLFISVHCGMIQAAEARGLKAAGVDQALIDIIGHGATYDEVYHLPAGPEQLRKSLDALTGAGLPIIPHIVAGLHFGQLLGEPDAVRLSAPYNPELLVVVVYMNLPGTSMEKVVPPAPEAVCGLICYARETLPQTEISLGCARPRKGSSAMEKMALLAGVNRMALPAEETVDLARRLGLSTTFRRTCCSVAIGPATNDHF